MLKKKKKKKKEKGETTKLQNYKTLVRKGQVAREELKLCGCYGKKTEKNKF